MKVLCTPWPPARRRHHHRGAEGLDARRGQIGTPIETTLMVSRRRGDAAYSPSLRHEIGRRGRALVEEHYRRMPTRSRAEATTTSSGGLRHEPGGCAGRSGNAVAHADSPSCPPVPVRCITRCRRIRTASFNDWVVSPDTFGRQMGWLARSGYTRSRSIPCAQTALTAQRCPPQQVAITFSTTGSRLSAFAADVLQRLRFTTFLVAGFVGQPSRWLLRECGVEPPLTAGTRSVISPSRV